jgi:hypothetical protein
MTSMTAAHFVKKWSKIQLKERTSAQSHFNDICALVDHNPPLETDTDRPGGEHGWADAWYKGRFVWEYKSPDKNLETACVKFTKSRTSPK